MSDAAGAVLVAAAVGSILVVAELWARVGRPPPEWPRKLVHLGGGMVCLAFPWLVTSPWTVFGLSLGLSTLFALGRWRGLLRSLHGVARSSRGGEWYPLAIAVAFALSGGQAWMYLPAVLTLGVADAFAALIGSSYGRLRYRVEDEAKSVEGSLVFLIIAFLGIHLPLVLLTDLPPAVCVLAALLAALVVTGFEAIALGGFDNLLVPLGVCIILHKATAQTPEELGLQVCVLVGLSLVAAVVAHVQRDFNAGGAIVLALFLYGCWSLGSWIWGLAALAALALWAAVRLAVPGSPADHGALRVRAALALVLPPFLWVALADGGDDHARAFAPFVATCAVTAALGVLSWLRRQGRLDGARWWFGAFAVALVAVVVVPGSVWLARGGSAAMVAPTVLAILLLPPLYAVLGREASHAPALRFALAMTAGLAVFLAQHLGQAAIWPWKEFP